VKALDRKLLRDLRLMWSQVPGAQVIVYPPTTVRDGVRVKARKV
jgi:hypothetical protein